MARPAETAAVTIAEVPPRNTSVQDIQAASSARAAMSRTPQAGDRAASLSGSLSRWANRGAAYQPKCSAARTSPSRRSSSRWMMAASSSPRSKASQLAYHAAGLHNGGRRAWSDQHAGYEHDDRRRPRSAFRHGIGHRHERADDLAGHQHPDHGIHFGRGRPVVSDCKPPAGHRRGRAACARRNGGGGNDLQHLPFAALHQGAHRRFRSGNALWGHQFAVTRGCKFHNLWAEPCPAAPHCR